MWHPLVTFQEQALGVVFQDILQCFDGRIIYSEAATDRQVGFIFHEFVAATSEFFLLFVVAFFGFAR